MLAAICFLLYKRYKLNQGQRNSIPTPGSEGNYHNHENLVIFTRNTYNQGRGQEILQIPEVPIYNNIYNHGRPIANNNNHCKI